MPYERLLLIATILLSVTAAAASNLEGESPTELLARAKVIAQKINPRDEFETTHDYEARVASQLATTHLNFCSVVHNGLQFEYDADSTSLKISAPHQGYPAASDHGSYQNVQLFGRSIDKGVHVGTTVAGVKAKFKLTDDYSEAIFYPVAPLVLAKGRESWDKVEVDLGEFFTEVAPDVARHYKGRLAIVYCGTLQAPYYERYEGTIDASLSDLHQIDHVSEGIFVSPQVIKIIDFPTGQIFMSMNVAETIEAMLESTRASGICQERRSPCFDAAHLKFTLPTTQ